MKNGIAIAVVAGLAAAASAQDMTISLVAPASVGLGETYTVEVWGSVSGGSWVQGTSAMAGFGIGVTTNDDALVASITSSTIASWAQGFGTNGTVVGADLLGTSGGQIANVFNLNPGINMSNPIMLFTFDVTAGGVAGTVTYSPSNPNPNGALSYYPVSTNGASVIAPNTAGTNLILTGASTQIVPAPASLALLGLGGLAARRRR